MQLTNRSKVVSNKEMTAAEAAYIPAVLKGMAVTLKHFFKRPATVKYPEEQREFSEVYRGKHVLKRDENGAERCTACGLCAVACPAEAITMVADERKKGEEKKPRNNVIYFRYIPSPNLIFFPTLSTHIHKKNLSLQLL